jgi:predicted metal-dependent hydrolase
VTHAFQFLRPQGVQVTYRRMKFDFEEQGFDRYWHGGSPFKSLFWSQLSAAFDPGETFFIDSARALRKQIDNPELLAELQEFCRQEGQHTAQHIKFDRKNTELGIDIDMCRRRYERILNHARKQLDPMHMLAATVALEHFTACFADQFFKNPQLSAGGDPKVVALWAWHAAEESEHRATCYDIYRACGGTYRVRVVSLIGSWALILYASLVNTAILLHRDGKLFTRDTLSGLRYLFGRKGLVSGLVPAFLEYCKPNFHPWKGADGSAIEKWKEQNRKYVQNLPDAA